MAQLAACAANLREQIAKLDADSDSDSKKDGKRKGGAQAKSGAERKQMHAKKSRLLSSMELEERGLSTLIAEDREEKEEDDVSSSDSDFLNFHEDELRKFDETFDLQLSRAMVRTLIKQLRGDARLKTATEIAAWFDQSLEGVDVMEQALRAKEEECAFMSRDMEMASRHVSSMMETRGQRTVAYMRRFHNRISWVQDLFPELRQRLLMRGARHHTMQSSEALSDADDSDEGEGADAGTPEEAEAGGDAAAAAAGAAPKPASAAEGKEGDETEMEGEESVGHAGRAEMLGQMMTEEASRKAKLAKKKKKGKAKKSMKSLAADLLDVISQQQEEIANLRGRSDLGSKRMENMKRVLEYVRVAAREEANGGPQSRRASFLPELTDVTKDVLKEMRENIKVKTMIDLLKTSEGRAFLAQNVSEHKGQLEALLHDAESHEEVMKLQSECAAVEKELRQTVLPVERMEMLKNEISAAEARIERARVAEERNKRGNEFLELDGEEASGSPTADGRKPKKNLGKSKNLDAAAVAARGRRGAINLTNEEIQELLKTPSGLWISQASDKMLTDIEAAQSELSKGVAEIESQKQLFMDSLFDAKRRFVQEAWMKESGTVDFSAPEPTEFDKMKLEVKNMFKALADLQSDDAMLHAEEIKLRETLEKYKAHRRNQEAAVTSGKRRKALSSLKKSRKLHAAAAAKAAAARKTAGSNEQQAGACQDGAGGEASRGVGATYSRKAHMEAQRELLSARKEIRALEKTLEELQARLALQAEGGAPGEDASGTRDGDEAAFHNIEALLVEELRPSMSHSSSADGGNLSPTPEVTIAAVFRRPGTGEATSPCVDSPVPLGDTAAGRTSLAVGQAGRTSLAVGRRSAATGRLSGRFTQPQLGEGLACTAPAAPLIVARGRLVGGRPTLADTAPVFQQAPVASVPVPVRGVLVGPASPVGRSSFQASLGVPRLVSTDEADAEVASVARAAPAGAPGSAAAPSGAAAPGAGAPSSEAAPVDAVVRTPRRGSADARGAPGGPGAAGGPKVFAGFAAVEEAPESGMSATASGLAAYAAEARQRSSLLAAPQRSSSRAQVLGAGLPQRPVQLPAPVGIVVPREPSAAAPGPRPGLARGVAVCHSAPRRASQVGVVFGLAITGNSSPPAPVSTRTPAAAPEEALETQATADPAAAGPLAAAPAATPPAAPGTAPATPTPAGRRATVQVTHDKNMEPTVLRLLAMEEERLRFQGQIDRMDAKIREAKRSEVGGVDTRASKVVPTPSVPTAPVSPLAAPRRSTVQRAADEAPEENRHMRKMVNKRQRELNSLRERWWAERGRQQVTTDGLQPGQAEAAARLLLLLGQRPKSASSSSSEDPFGESSSSSNFSEVDAFGRDELADFTPVRRNSFSNLRFDSMEDQAKAKPGAGRRPTFTSTGKRASLTLPTAGMTQKADPDVTSLGVFGKNVDTSDGETGGALRSLRTAARVAGAIRWIGRLSATTKLVQ